MNKTLQAALAATLVLSAAGTARADLTMNGAVGLPLNPTAQIPMTGGARVQANYHDLGDAGGGVDFKHYGAYVSGRVWRQLELNGGVEKLRAKLVPGLDNTGIAIGAKYLFTRETDPIGVRIAAGAGYSRVLLKNTHVYLVASKTLGQIGGERPPVTGHLGIRWDRHTLEDIGGPKSRKASVYGGVEVPLTATGNFSLVGELQSKNNEFGGARAPYSAALRWRQPGQGFSASIGVQRHGVFTTDNGILLQLGYTWDTAAGGVEGGDTPAD